MTMGRVGADSTQFLLVGLEDAATNSGGLSKEEGALHFSYSFERVQTRKERMKIKEEEDLEFPWPTLQVEGLELQI